MELGLISEPSLKSIPFGAFPSDAALASNKFPSINSTIDAAKRPPREAALRFAAKMSAQSSRKTSSRGTSHGRRRASKSSDASWERKSDRARTATAVQSFWKSCNGRLGTARKRGNKNYRELDSRGQETDRDRFFDPMQSVELSAGIGYQAYLSSDSATSHFQRMNGISCAKGRGGKLASKGRAKRKRGREPARIVDNVEAEPPSVSTSRDRADPSDAGDEILARGCCEFGEVDAYSLNGDCLPANDRVDRRFESSPIECVSDACDGFATSTKDAGSDPRSPLGSLKDGNDAAALNDVDTLPLAQRISDGNKGCMGRRRTCSPESLGESERDESRETPNNVSNRCHSTWTVRESSDVYSEKHEKSLINLEGHRRRAQSGQASDCLATLGATEMSSDDGSRCWSIEKPPSTAKRNKPASSERVAGASVQGAVKIDAIRAKIFGNEEEYHDIRRVTRGSKRFSKENFVGKLVWGCCSGWWPAIIIDADHVGMLSEAGKLWVYWIGEARISLLNEKTQIESFSNNLKYRLAQTTNVARVRAIDATMQMLRKRLSCTLTKPYTAWIENNFSEVIEMLDEIKFYPYPPRVQQRLDHLKEKNAKVTEKYLLDQKRENQTKKAIEKPKESLQPNDVDLTRLSLREQHPGVVTWAKIAGHNWWPAMIIDYRDCCMREPSFGCQWIMWYGDYKLSEVHHLLFLKFDKGIAKMHDYIKNTKKHVFLVGVLQATKDYCSRLGCDTDDWTLADVFKYFSKSNRSQSQYDPPKKGESLKIYDKYSAHIVKKLNELKNNPNIDDKRADDIKNSADLRSVLAGDIPVQSLCLKCLKIPKGPLEAHPFFEGSLCKDCSEQYKPCMFVFGNDAKCFYCTVCASSGTVIICDNEDCPRVYCTACMKHLLCPTTYDEVLLEDPWECFLCKSKSDVFSNTIVKPRPNWKNQLIDMFRTNCNSNVRTTEHCEKKRKIRVLSLFDGLSTGLLVLLKLNLDVDVYYASEIDPDALLVSASHFGDRIVRLGDVRSITKERIREMAPIDLLIGGSPCNDLSLANPARLGLYGACRLLLNIRDLKLSQLDVIQLSPLKLSEVVSWKKYFPYVSLVLPALPDILILHILLQGVERHTETALLLLCESFNSENYPKGTGVLFFEYCRIMKLVKKMNNGRHLFWMYENVASMPTEYRSEMNKHLGQEPDVIDSADFSPQHRLRLYWHNLPIESHSLSSQGEQDVQDILTPHCQRYALVKKIRTVTTKVNSLKQGKSALKPILMKDESDSLWITELEEIFGFPRHYTDVKNLSATKRQRLIGKSWSVQTLTAILRSLCPFFECNTT